MSRQVRKSWALYLAATMFLAGCHPAQPFYFNEDGDLSHLLKVATDLQFPDEYRSGMTEVDHVRAPLTISNPEFGEIWDLSLQETVALTLHNSKIIRSSGRLISQQVTGGNFLPSLEPNIIDDGFGGTVTSQPGSIDSVYDAAIAEADPVFGVEAALADFDAVFSLSTSLERNNRPQNFSAVFAPVLVQDRGSFTAGITKKTAPGTQVSIRNNTIYDQSNTPVRALPSDWSTNFEVEARHPLLKGGGVQINRIPIILARIRTDLTLADFEAATQEMVYDAELAYWDLYFAYRSLETAKVGRDSSLITWKKIHALKAEGARGGEAEKEAQARQQYYEFRAFVESALRDLYKSENRLRFIMGLAATDGRLIRPLDEPTTAKVTFDWYDIHCEAMVRNVKLRKQKWRIKHRKMELIAARNELLPQLDVVGLYRWLGVGDDLIESPRQGLNFPAEGSLAFDELTEGNYQEWRVGLELGLPIGFRRELAGVRHKQLLLARTKAFLEDMELDVSHQLTGAVQNVDSEYVLAQTNFNRRAAADKEVDAVQAAYELGTVTLDLLLDAQRRQAEAEIAYYRSVVNYNKAIVQVHLSKSSLLEYNNVYLAEGPWPKKAYYDALGHARRRDASCFLDYGNGRYTRPSVISRGPLMQHEESGDHGTGEIIIEEGFEETIEIIPSPSPQPVASRQPTAGRAPWQTYSKTGGKQSFDWGSLGGLKEYSPRAGDEQSGVRQAAYHQPTSASKHESLTNPSTAQADRPAATWKRAQH